MDTVDTEKSSKSKLEPVVLSKATLLPLGVVLIIGLLIGRLSFEAGTTNSKINDNLELIRSSIVSVSSQVDRLAGKVDSQSKDISDMKNDMADLKARVANLERQTYGNLASSGK